MYATKKHTALPGLLIGMPFGLLVLGVKRDHLLSQARDRHRHKEGLVNSTQQK